MTRIKWISDFGFQNITCELNGFLIYNLEYSVTERTDSCKLNAVETQFSIDNYYNKK